jgi:hypothetical protein
VTASAAASTAVDGTLYSGEWLQLDLPAAAPVFAPSSYTIVPELAAASAGTPNGQPRRWVLAGLPVGGSSWTALDLKYATGADYSPGNVAISVAVSDAQVAAARQRAGPLASIRLIVTRVSVAAAAPGVVQPPYIGAAVCALSVSAPPAPSSLSLGAGVALLTGQLGLGTAAPQQRLDVRGSACVSGRLGIGIQAPQYALQLSSDSAAKPSTSLWTVFSDRRLKDELGPVDLQRCYDIVAQVPLKRFAWRDDTHSAEQAPDRCKLGWMAQDVARAFPKSVAAQPAFGLDDCLSLNGDQMLAALYGAVQRLQQRVDALELQLQQARDVPHSNQPTP